LTSERYIHKKIEGLIIQPIPGTEPGAKYIFVRIPRSLRAPHMHNPSNKFYKRYNFKAEPMQGYEVEDIRNRSDTPKIEVRVERGSPQIDGAGIIHRYKTLFWIENCGLRTLRNFQFEFCLPNRMFGYLEGQYMSRQETLNDEQFCIIPKRCVGDDSAIFPGEKHCILSIRYFINTAAYSVISSGVPEPRWRIRSDNCPEMSGAIPWSELQKY
jgi:hypothetical protein